MAANPKAPNFPSGSTLDDFDRWVENYQPSTPAQPAINAPAPAMTAPKPVISGLDEFDQWVRDYQPVKPEQGLWQQTKNTGRALVEGVTDSWPEFKSQFGAAMEGGTPFDDQNQYDEWQAQAKAKRQGFLTAPGGQDPTLLDATVGQMKGEIAANFPQTGAMLAGAAAGLPIGGLPGAVVGAGLAGTGALVPMYYGQKTANVRDFAEVEDANRQAKGLPAMTLPEKQSYQAKVQPEAETQARWDTGPELIGMAAGLTPLGAMMKPAAGPLLKSALSMAGLKTAARGALIEGASILPGEIAEETISEIGRRPIDRQHVMPGQPVPQELGWNPADIASTAAEVALPTARGMLPMALLGMGAGAHTSVASGRQRYNDALEAVRAAAKLTDETGIQHTAEPDPENPEQFTVQPNGQTDSVLETESVLPDQPFTIKWNTKGETRTFNNKAEWDEEYASWKREADDGNQKAKYRAEWMRQQVQKHGWPPIPKQQTNEQSQPPIEQTQPILPVPQNVPTQTSTPTTQGPLEAPATGLPKQPIAPVPKVTVPDSLLSSFPDLPPRSDTGLIDENLLTNDERNAVEAAGLFEIGETENGTHRGVDPEKLWLLRKKRASEIAAEKSNVTQSEDIQGPLEAQQGVALDANAPSDTTEGLGFKSLFQGAGKAIGDKFLQDVFTSLNAGKNTVHGVKEPMLDRAIPAYKAGLIKNTDDLRYFESNGYPELPLEVATNERPVATLNPPGATARPANEPGQQGRVPDALRPDSNLGIPSDGTQGQAGRFGAGTGPNDRGNNDQRPQDVGGTGNPLPATPPAETGTKTPDLPNALGGVESRRLNQQLQSIRPRPAITDTAERINQATGVNRQPAMGLQGLQQPVMQPPGQAQRTRPNDMATAQANAFAAPGMMQADRNRQLKAEQEAKQPTKTASSKPNYEDRVKERVSRIEKATTANDIQSVVDDEHTDSERYYVGGTEAVERAARENKERITKREQRQASYDSGEWVELEPQETYKTSDNQAVKQLNERLDKLKQQDSQHEYRISVIRNPFDLDDRSYRTIERRKKPSTPDMAAATTDTATGAELRPGQAQDTKKEKKQRHAILKMLANKGVPKAPGLYYLNEKQVTAKQRRDLVDKHGNRYEDEEWYFKPAEDVTGNHYDNGWFVKNKIEAKPNEQKPRQTQERTEEAEAQQEVKPTATGAAQAEEKPEQPNLDTVSEDPEMAKLQGELYEAMKDVGEAFVNLNPFVMKAVEVDSAKMLPALTKVMDIAFRMGYHSFKKNAQFVLAAIRKQFGNEAADALTLRQVKGAYNFMAEGKALADDEDAVAAVKSLDEITRDVSVENAETEKSKQVAQTKETSITPNEFYAEWKTRLPNEKITVSDVAKGWGITSSAATALLNKLVDQGLVTKKYWSATRVTDYSLASSPGEEKRNPGEGEPAPERANNQASSSLSDILGGQPAQIISDVTGTLSVAGQRVPFYWMLVDRDILNPTTDRADNQFRDRNRAASAEQIANMAGNLDHELLVDSPTMGDGAPVLAVDKQTVIAGNGRVMAIGAAYRQNKAERYKTYLADNAEKWGFTRAQVDNMDMPVLVRVFSNPVDIQAAAIASNEAGGASISALEQARIDGLRLGDLTNFNPDDNGNFNTVANRSFIRQFLANMPVNQRGAFQTADGSLSKEGVTRLRNAVLYRAYGDSDVLSRIAETTDEGQRNLLNALVAIAPLAARVKDDINSGDLYDLDITADIVEATNLLRMIKEEGKFSNAEDYFKQQNLFEDPFSDESKQLLLYFERNLRSSKAIKEFLGDYYAAVSALGSPKQISLLDDAVPGKLKLLKRASDENTRSKAEPETSLFDQATGRNSPANRRQPNENGVVETNDAGQQQTETVNPNEPSTRGSVERNRQDDTAQDGLGGGAVRQESGGTARDTGRTGGDIETQRQESVGDRGLPAVGAATGGERGDQPMDAATGQFRLEKSLARGAERERGAIAGSERVEAGQAGSGAVEGVVEGVVKRNPVDYAKRLQDIAYSTSELVDGNRKAMLALSSALGKSGRDDILSETLGISRSEAHAINNQLDGRQAHRLRKEDMEDIYEQFPPLRKIVDEAKPSSIIAVYQTQTGKIAAQVTRTVIGGRESYSYTGEVGASSGDREHVLQSLKRNFQGKRNIHLVRGEDFAELEAKPEVPTPEAKINLNTPKEPETPTAAIEGLLDGEAESLIDNAINAANWQELKAATQAIKDRYGVHLYQVPQGQPAKDGGKVWHWYDLSNDTTYGMPMTEAEARVKLRKGLIEAQANKQRDIDLRAKYPVLPTGKEADTYKSTLSNRSAVSRFYTIAKEVGEIGQAYGPQQVYVFKGELVRLEYPSVSNRDYAYIHKVQPSDVTGWKKTKLAKEWQAKPSSPDEAKRNPGRNEPAKPDVPKQELGNEQSGEIVGVTSDSPHKTNSSYGNWAVDVVVKIPFGNGTISESRFFFNKSDAVKFINDTKAKLGNEQLEPIPDETLDDLIAATHNEAKLKAQQAAEKIAVIPNNRANIDATLPILTEGQREDVHFAETRWDKPDGYGVLFANGTGTGKTYVGLGAIKRSVSQGKGNVLIVVPSDAIAQGWIRSGKDLNLDIQSLPDTKTAGKGVVITTFANLGMNDALASREWDLVVADEAHYLMNNAQATVTAALERLRAITYNPLGAQDRAQMLNRTLFDDWSRMMKNAARSRANQDTMDEILRADEAEANRLDAEWQAHRRNVKNDIQARQGKDRTRALFLSATPFAYEKNVAWGEGYLFDFPRSESSRYNEPTGFDKFMVQHFGYRMRYNKLNEPDVNVDRDIMQRNFNTWMRREGKMSTRMLDVDFDYERRFILVDDAVGQKIDQGLEFLSQAENGRYRPLANILWDKFDYLARSRLLQAIKARAAIPIIQAHHALGRKVVVFYDLNEGGGSNVFNFDDLLTSDMSVGNVPVKGQSDKISFDRLQTETVALSDLAKEFRALKPDLWRLDFSSYLSPLQALTQAFPDAGLNNGTEPKKKRMKAIDAFNDDSQPQANLLIVQKALNAGWSGHDTTGQHQRVIINLGQPTAPIESIQQEGRIYRVGQASNAIFQYLNTGTNWERYAFATRIARRAATAENLAMGEQARGLREAFIQAFEDSTANYQPEMGEGTGGKESDRAMVTALTDWDLAKSMYFSQGKRTSRNRSQEGTDYFATPEPLGVKLVEWADIRPNDSVLEPSAGHGAIARFFPSNARQKIIEPSPELASRAALATGQEIIQERFEEHYLGNKYDAVVMNPPFGTSGKTAMEHVEKAFGHLRDGGRVVAIIPRGPAMDKRFEQWLGKTEEKSEKIEPLTPTWNNNKIYVGDTVTYMGYPNANSNKGYGLMKGVVTGKAFGSSSILVRRDNGTEDNINATTLESLEPTGKRTQKVTVPNEAHLVASIDLPPSTFERAGTQVAARVVVIERHENPADATIPLQTIDLSDADNINELFARLENLDVPKRNLPESDTGNGMFNLAETTHAQKNIPLFVATLAGRVEREEYDRVNALAKKHGGYYSAYAKQGAIPGFQFETAEKRAAFVREAAGASDGDVRHSKANALYSKAEVNEYEPIETTGRLYDATGKPHPDISEDGAGSKVLRGYSITRQEAEELERAGVLDIFRFASRGPDTTGMQGWFLKESAVKSYLDRTNLQTGGNIRRETQDAIARKLKNNKASLSEWSAYNAPDAAMRNITNIFMQRDFVSFTRKPSMGRGEWVVTIERKGNQQPENLYSFAKRKTLPFKGMSQQAAQRVVDGYLQGLKGLGDLKVKVYPTQAAAGLGSSREVIEAEFHISGNTLKIVAENFKNPAHLLKKLSHEVVAHYGVRQLLGEEQHRKVMNEVERAAKANPEFRAEWIRLSGRDPRNNAVVNDRAPYFKTQGRYDRAEIADEVLASMAERGIETSWMRRILDFITRALRAIGVIRGPMTQREMMALLARAERGLRTGNQMEDKRGMVSGKRRLSQAQAQGYQGTDTGEAEEWLRAKAKGLDMSQSARMERAKQWGNTDRISNGDDAETGKSIILKAYHGSNYEIKEFDDGMLGDVTGAKSAKNAFFAATDPITPVHYLLGDDGLQLEHIDRFFRKVNGITMAENRKLTWNQRYANEQNLIKAMENGIHPEFRQEEQDAITKINDISKKYKTGAFRRVPYEQWSNEDKAEYNNAMSSIELNRAILGMIERSANKTWQEDIVDDEQNVNFIPLTGNRDLKPNIMPLLISLKNPLVYDQEGKDYREITYAELIEQAKNEDRDGVIIKNTKDPSPTTNIVAFFEPKQARSIFAAFDPDYAESGNLRASVAEVPKQERGNEPLLAPNGKPSNLNAVQWEQVRTPEFKAWFGDWENDPANASKVVDENGEPLVVYHGTGEDFTHFRKDVKTKHIPLPGHFFTPDKIIADRFAESSGNEWRDSEGFIEGSTGANTIPVFLNIKKLENINANDSVNKGYVPASVIKEILDDFRYSGKDGVKITGWRDGSGEIQYSVFDGNNIKSATGNTGEFSPTNPDIRYSKSTPIDPLDPNAAPVFADRVNSYSLGNLKDIPKFVKANLQGMRALGLKTLGRQWMTEIYQDDLPGLKAHNKLMMAFDADPNERQARAGTVSQEWGGLQREDADSLADIMHVSTVHGVDASKEVYEPRYTPEQVQADFYAELNEVWDVYRKKRAVVKSNRGDPPNDVMYEWQKALSDLIGLTYLPAKELNRMAQAYQKRGIQPDWEEKDSVKKALKRRINSRMKAERARKAQWEALQAPWRNLSPKARELYNTAKNMYQDMWKDSEKALVAMILRGAGFDVPVEVEKSPDFWDRVAQMQREMPADKRETNNMIARMRLIFRREVPEVYFPLHRDGEYVVVVKGAPDALGFRKNVGVFREQSLAQAERLADELRQRYASQPYEVMPIFKQPIRTKRDAADSAFVAQVINLIGVEGGGHKMDQLRENVMELYYQALPDLSWAKHEMHRRKVPGYSRDARKAFAHHISHGANHLARIRYIDRLEKSLDDMQATVDEHKYSVSEGWDAIKAQDLVNSLKQRHEFAMNPPNVPLANKLTSIGFVWYLGLSPASALVNTLQTPLVAGPVLGSKFGLLKSAGALLKASGDVLKALKFEGGKGIKGVSPSEKAIVARLRAQLSEDEFRAIEKAIVDGHATVTLAHDLAGVAQGKEHGEVMEAVLRAASFMFHQTELFNRLTTILAAYRLGRDKGLSHGGAYDTAIDLDYMAHFDYAANNRAPVIAGPVARVITQFKQYQLNSITLWAHNGVQTLLAMPDFLRGRPLDERQKEAIRLFRGLLVTHALAAGVLGLPMVGTFLAVASALGGDDDEPWDAEVALRNVLADALGPRFAEAVVHGVPRLGRDVLPADIAGRVGMDRLLFPDIQEGLEPVRWYEEFAMSMLGPVAGIGLNAAKGLQTWGDGDWARGLEEMSPKVVKDALKMGRYAREGVKDKTGIEILDDPSWGEMASQLLGFTPARVSEAMESRGAVYNLDRRLTRRRSELMDEWGDAVMNKESPRAVLAEIREFNQANPRLKITLSGMRQSLNNRRKRVDQAQGGVYLPPKRRGEREVGRFFQG